MVRHHQPRKGSVAFSPRKRVAKETPRIKAWPSNEEPKLLGLAGYLMLWLLTMTRTLHLTV